MVLLQLAPARGASASRTYFTASVWILSYASGGPDGGALRVHISLRWLRYALVLYCVNVDYFSVQVKNNGFAGASPPGTYFTALVALRVSFILRQC